MNQSEKLVRYLPSSSLSTSRAVSGLRLNSYATPVCSRGVVVALWRGALLLGVLLASLASSSTSSSRSHFSREGGKSIGLVFRPTS